MMSMSWERAGQPRCAMSEAMPPYRVIIIIVLVHRAFIFLFSLL